MVAHACNTNPSTWEPEAEHHEFQTSAGEFDPISKTTNEDNTVKKHSKRKGT